MSYEIYNMDCRDAMRLFIEPKSVQMCVTSPPYFGLRDYGHEGQLGLEQTPEQYVTAMVEVFRCVWDVLADDGTLWLNIGDSYATGTKADRQKGDALLGGATSDARTMPRIGTPTGCKTKDLIGIPWMLAFALRADGWYLRQEIIWHKPNPMPESVTDRCTKAHESLFLLSKQPKYFIDPEGLKEPAVGGAKGSEFHTGKTGEHQLGRASAKPRSKSDSFKRDGSKRGEPIVGQSEGTHRADREDSSYPLETRNKRSVWTIPTKPYKGAHFAVFPEALVDPCIRAGSRPGDTVLDPFGGSGTTAGVAAKHGRKAILCELNPDYLSLIPSRVEKIVGVAL